MKVFVIFLFIASALSAQLRTSQIHRSSTSLFEDDLDGVIAQVVDGGPWQTTITLASTDTKAGNYTIKFFTDDGKPMNVPTTDGIGNTLTGMIPAGGSHRIMSLDSGQNTIQGWALVQVTALIGGNATFRQRVQGRPDFEASMPIMFYLDGNDYIIPFDNLNTSTGIGLVNPISFQTITIFLTFRDESGNRLLLDSLTLAPMQHMSFDLGQRFPPSFGVRGSVEITTTSLSVNILALRFLGAAFSSVLPIPVEHF